MLMVFDALKLIRNNCFQIIESTMKMFQYRSLHWIMIIVVSLHKSRNLQMSEALQSAHGRPKITTQNSSSHDRLVSFLMYKKQETKTIFPDYQRGKYANPKRKLTGRLRKQNSHNYEYFYGDNLWNDDQPVQEGRIKDDSGDDLWNDDDDGSNNEHYQEGRIRGHNTSESQLSENNNIDNSESRTITSANHLMDVWIGTPPQHLSLKVSTMSAYTVVDCGLDFSQTVQGSTNTFDPESSSSFAKLTCDECHASSNSCEENSPIGRGEDQCPVFGSYGGSSWTAFEVSSSIYDYLLDLELQSRTLYLTRPSIFFIGC